METSLKTFIDHARKKGMDHQTIRMLLLANGWKEKDIAQALTEQALDMPVPMPTDTGGAREAFFHLLTFASFYTTMISVIILFFTYINKLFPDPALNDGYYQASYDLTGIRWSLAAIIVAFPLFMWLSRFLLKEMVKHPERSWSGVRRWLTYLTLFIAATAIMGDVITLVFRLLEGELSMRFILKVLVVLLTAGLSFAYYFTSMKLDVRDARAKTTHRIFGAIASAVVLIAVVYGIWLVGSPGAERERKFDERRVQDLQNIQNEIRSITLGKNQGLPVNEQALVNPLPETLNDVRARSVYMEPNILDPETSAPYEYKVTGESTFELCATFNFVRADQYDVQWNHPAGRHCYDFDVLDPTV
jgi:hypothetical protein